MHSLSKELISTRVVDLRNVAIMENVPRATAKETLSGLSNEIGDGATFELKDY